MNTTFTKETLAAWIEDIKDAAKDDTSFSIAWFKPTENCPISIIAGWQDMFDKEDYSDVFCCSKSNPKYVMCVKIAENEGPYAYTDFEIMNMPYDRDTGDVDDTCIPLEWDDNPECAAEFFMHEWERIMSEYEEEE
jgi:hypothetical protein